jgi:hypothetical protein
MIETAVVIVIKAAMAGHGTVSAHGVEKVIAKRLAGRAIAEVSPAAGEVFRMSGWATNPANALVSEFADALTVDSAQVRALTKDRGPQDSARLAKAHRDELIRAQAKQLDGFLRVPERDDLGRLVIGKQHDEVQVIPTLDQVSSVARLRDKNAYLRELRGQEPEKVEANETGITQITAVSKDHLELPLKSGQTFRFSQREIKTKVELAEDRRIVTKETKVRIHAGSQTPPKPTAPSPAPKAPQEPPAELEDVPWILHASWPRAASTGKSTS